jgi:uncharacterized protein YbaP (TraB family)
MIFDESASADAPGYIESALQKAMVHEMRALEGKIANQFHDRIAQLQKRIKELEGTRMYDVSVPRISQG